MVTHRQTALRKLPLLVGQRASGSEKPEAGTPRILLTAVLWRLLMRIYILASPQVTVLATLLWRCVGVTSAAHVDSRPIQMPHCRTTRRGCCQGRRLSRAQGATSGVQMRERCSSTCPHAQQHPKGWRLRCAGRRPHIYD